MRWFRADLHLHTVLSACADLSMGPQDIVKKALQKQLDIIAITDHNSAANTLAVHNAARDTKLTVIPGMEVNSREGIHMVCLFPDIEIVMAFHDFVYCYLQDGHYDPSMLGPQIICDQFENILGEDEHLLALPIKKSYKQVADQMVKLGGLIYPAHIERRANGMLSVLGMLPQDLPFNVIEVSRHIDRLRAQELYGQNNRWRVVTASDAHDLDQIGTAVSYFYLKAPTFSELFLSLSQQNGRETSIRLPAEMAAIADIR
ncbi:PHP domain-containing protein [candidate division KSB1 bacterium]|nr:PHP domain-containing protein [candidate division KSB1 bacterium]